MVPCGSRRPTQLTALPGGLWRELLGMSGADAALTLEAAVLVTG
ncbi:hypothetical protein D4764_09G0007220 [Takifugu flavidus]|uniref:Uncharacterized protein n=1 Tax=Takifugu flavidus TaxID=433684 RepID=A0A5C6MKN6_9TELE|nr:hypothetical protein D4764_09G0007220 [Takifugu flavidus]